MYKRQVNNIPIKKANIIIYGRFAASFFIVVYPDLTNKIVIIGISKDKPKAKNSLSMKFR